MTKLLFTSVYKPFGTNDFYNCPSAPMEFFMSNIGDEGLFTIRAIEPTYSLQYLAQNIETPSTVLDFPTRKEFIKEIRKNYDYVGIGFMSLAFEKVRDMCKLVRKYSPSSKIVLGGYGTVIPEASEIADYVCREEGVNFMKNLLNEKKSSEIKQAWEPYNSKYSIMGTKLMSKKTKPGLVLVALGCTGGCEFCNTSYFFHKKKIYILKTAEEIYKALKHQNTNYIMIVDENFLENKKLVKSLGKIIKKNNDSFDLMCFGTLKAVSEYTPEELLEIGINKIWISAESKFVKYPKLHKIDIKKLTSSLHNSGIHLIISFIIGYPFHNKEKLKEDINYFLSLSGEFKQYHIYTAPPGTPLYSSLKKQNKLLNRPWKEYDASHLMFKHPYFSKKELEKIKINIKKNELKDSGPSLIRFIETKLLRYKKYKNSGNKFLARNAKEAGLECHNLLPLVYTSKLFVNKKIKNNISNLIKEIEKNLGKRTANQKLLAPILIFRALMLNARIKLFGSSADQPDTQIIEYNFS